MFRSYFNPTILITTLVVLLFSASFAFAVPPHPDMKPELRARAIEVYLRAKERSPELDAPGPLQQPSGTYRAIVILVDFDDNEGQTNKSLYEDLLFSLGTYPTGSMRDYYIEVSYNQFEVDGDVNGTEGTPPDWFRMPQNYSFYVDGQYGWGAYPENAQKLAEDAVVAADQYVDYTLYDNNNDGEVDSLFIVHAGPGYEVTGNPNDVWSHRWVMVNPPVLDKMNFSGYTMEPEYIYNLGDSTIGVFAHEYGHELGLPDLYDISNPKGNGGIGRWGLMSSGAWNGPLGLGSRPAHPCAWSKIQLNWVTPTVTSTNQTGVSIPQVETNQSIFRLWTDGTIGEQYFLVENRQRTLFDDGLPGDGLLIYHVDDSVPWQNNPKHYKVDVEQADGNSDLNKYTNRGDAGDPWPGTSVNRTFNAKSTPNSKDYNDNNTWVAVTNISDSAAAMTADIYVTKFEIPLKAGLNLIALPREPDPSYTSFTLIPAIPFCTAVSRWNKETQSWEDAIEVAPGIITGVDFDIVKGEGYFVLVTADTSFSDYGYLITTPVTLEMKQDLNLVGIPYPSNPPIPPGYTGYTSFTLIPAIGCGICTAVSMWDKNLQQWRDAIDVGGCFIIGEDFDIVNDEGYFLLLTQDYTWTPGGGITSLSVAKNEANITPLYRIEANSSPPKESRITESNLSSSSITISWTADAPSNGAVLYGQTSSLGQEARSIIQGSYTHWARLKGLISDTVYYYKVVSTEEYSGKLYNFRTPSIRRTLANNPHLLYGKVQRDGKPKEGVIVYAKIEHEEGTSGTISTVTGKDGTWLLNLGNFKGDVKAGDKILLEADGGILGYVSKEIYVVSAPSPQDVGVLTLLPSITQKAEITLRGLPKKSALLKNYPNPFNPETWIPYQLSEGSDVKIRIYNATGQLVRELDLNYKDAGFYLSKDKAAYWDGKNEANEAVASGVYFYQIKAGKFVSVKRFVVLK